MIYTIKDKNVIFELPLFTFFGSTTKRDKDGNNKRVYWDNLQDFESDLWFNFESFFSYIEPDDDAIQEAREILKKDGYTDAEMDLFNSDIYQDVKMAMADAKDESYMAEWLDQFRVYIADRIDDNLPDGAQVIDDITSKTFDFCQDHIKISVPIATIKNSYKDTPDENIDDLIDEYADDYLADIPKEINTEYIDRYGQLGDVKGWQGYFQDISSVPAVIKNYRNDEADKINNVNRLYLLACGKTKAITEYIDEYFTAPEPKQKIKRQIKALESVIKNAV